MSRARVVATVHGLDSRRGKWGGGASRALRGAEWLVPRAPHETVVVAKDLVQHFDQSYGRAVTHIPNGVNRPTVTAPSQPVDSPYVLFVGRLVPEKAPDLLIAAFAKVQTGHRLVIAGGSSHTDGFVADLEQLASGDDRVDLPGYVYGDDLATLYAGADAFVLPSLLEGLPLTLLEAASYGLPLIASDISPHREVLTLSRPGGRLSVTGDADSLTASIQQVLDDLPAEREGAAQLREQVLARYDWDRAVDELLVVYGERRPTVIELDNPVPAADRART